MKLTKKAIPFFIIGAIAVLVTVSIIARNKKSFIEVETVDVVLGDFSKEVSSNGEIRSMSESVSIARVSGNIRKIFVEEGDRVKKGDVLISIEKKDIDSQVRNAAATLENTKMSVRRELLSYRSSYAQASSAYDRIRRDAERTAELQKIGSASDEELRLKMEALEGAGQSLFSAREQLNLREGRALADPRTDAPADETDIVMASTEVRQAEAQLKSARDTVDNYEIRALSDGVVTRLDVPEGGVVATGMVVATVHDNLRLEIVTNIDEVDLSYLRVGQGAKVESDSFIGDKIAGTVESIAPIIRKVGDSRVCEIILGISDDPKRLARIGAGCSVFIEVEKKTQVPSIPVESYFLKDGKSYAAVLLEGDEKDTFKVQLQEIETGILGVETVEVKSGLSEGQKIISKKASKLADGDTVKLMKEKKKTKESANDSAPGNK